LGTEVDGAVNPSSSRQPAIGRIDDGIDLLVGDVALLQFERLTMNFDPHGNSPCIPFSPCLPNFRFPVSLRPNPR
jgi:hypothetical protein